MCIAGTRRRSCFGSRRRSAVSDQFTDTGLPKQLAAPPDPNFDHANFYWRMELQPEAAGDGAFGEHGRERRRWR